MARILYIIDSLTVAGAQVHLVRLANDMAETMQVRVICLGPLSAGLVSQLRSEVVVDTVRMESIRHGAFFPSFLRLVWLIRAWRPEIVHTYLNTANVFGVLAARLAGVRWVVTSRRDMGAFRSGRVASVEALLSRRCADRTFCVCRAVAARTVACERIQPAKVRVLYNGVALDAIQPVHAPSTKGRIRFGMVARMNRVEKGHAVFLAAAAIVGDRRRGRASFVLVGDGPLKPDLVLQAQRSGLGEQAVFVGEVLDTGQALGMFDVCVVPSHTEGISNAAIESMAAGHPVVATAVDGNLEVVIDGRTGFLVPPGSPEALAERLIKFLDDPALLEAQGQSGRKRCEEVFSRDAVREQYLREYNELLLDGASG